MAGGSSESRERLVEILEALASRELVSPGDVVVRTGLPRYLVLASFQCLEALGLVEQAYSRGSYKVYSLTIYGRRVLEALKAGAEAPLLAVLPAPASQPGQAAVAGEEGAGGHQ